MKKFLSFMVAAVLVLSLAACNQGAKAIDIVKNGQLNAYPGKPIAETFEKALAIRSGEYSIEWSDVTDSELGQAMAETMEEEGYNRAVSSVLSANGDKITIIWWVNTESENFTVFSVSDGSELYSTSDSEVTDFFDTIFNDSDNF